MKHARYQGLRVEAADGAPLKARCPDCQGPVTLRSKKGDCEATVTFFYRHVEGRPTLCSRRGRFKRPPTISTVPTASLYKLKHGRAWYNIMVETGMLLVYRVTRTWGRGGRTSKGVSVTKDLTNRQDAEAYAQDHVKRLMRKGYELMEWV
jgi:predicted DNA-binding WGR domain protein